MLTTLVVGSTFVGVNRNLPSIDRPLRMYAPWSYTNLVNSIDDNLVRSATISPAQSAITTLDTEGIVHQTDILPLQVNTLVDRLVQHNVDLSIARATPLQFLLSLASSLAPWLLLGGLYMVLTSRGNIGNIGMMQQRSAQPITDATRPNVTFSDVAGCEDTKRELTEIVDFLRNPEKFSVVGARIPRGVIMEGPPGTGKTLMARAIAGEADVNFYAISASAFVEMYVGLGAARVRQLFDSARRAAPSIVFIDEIDAVGKQRASSPSNMGGGNDEREQTLNQILSEMDGFSKDESVVVVAATNRADMLDNALLRPGRFDRRVPVLLPDAAARAEIFDVHARSKPLADDVTSANVARMIPGFSGADIEQLLNEAAINTARLNHTSITMQRINDAIDRVTLGLARKSIEDADTRRCIAYHEAGHALVGMLSENYDQVYRVTIRPRSNGAGGFTQFVPLEKHLDVALYSKTYMQTQLSVLLAGRVAEDVIFGTPAVTTGASSDLARAKRIAESMVNEWGFGESGLASLDGPRTSDAARERIEDEVEKLLTDAQSVALSMIETNLGLLQRIAERLIADETVYLPDLVDELQQRD